MVAPATVPEKDAVAARLDEVGTLLKSMKGEIESLNEPVRIHRDGGGYSQWMPQESPELALAKSARMVVAPYAAGYKPFQVWKTAQDFYKSGMFGWKTADFEGSLKKAVQGMSETVGADGAFTVLPEFNKTILEKVYANDLISRCDGYQVAGNGMTFWRNSETSRASGSRHGGLLGYWMGEGGALTASKPGFAELNLKLNKLGVVVYLTNELLSDTSMALETYINRKVSEEFSFLVGDAIFEGDGVAKPFGIASATAVAGNSALLKITKETGQPAKTIVTENIDKMWARLFAGSVLNSVWLVNQDTWPMLLSLVRTVGTAGVPVFVPPGGASAAPYGMLMGRPVLPIEFAATLGTIGDIVLADLKQYITITKGGIAQAQSMHVEFLTDQLALRFIMRLDGATWENTPVTPFHGTNTQSSFVALATRA